MNLCLGGILSNMPTSKKTTNSTGGFSLVELSIVLVILGLLVGGVLSGQSLIRAAETRALVTEQQRFRAAVSAFRDKYLALPGDMANASNFFAGANNGDGNGIIVNNSDPIYNEISNFWLHLSSSGLLESSYTQAAGTTFIAGTNCPQSRLGDAAWNIGYLGTIKNDGTN